MYVFCPFYLQKWHQHQVSFSGRDTSLANFRQSRQIQKKNHVSLFFFQSPILTGYYLNIFGGFHILYLCYKLNETNANMIFGAWIHLLHC